LQNGVTGNEIIERLCPDGELGEGVTYDLTGLIARISSEDGEGYSVQNIPTSVACGITSMGQADGIKITEQEEKVCRSGLIHRCNLKLITPIPAISELGMIATVVGLGIIGLLTTMRRKKAAV
jgi:metal-sulfur cluster biosynthetic enzyme